MMSLISSFSLLEWIGCFVRRLIYGTSSEDELWARSQGTRNHVLFVWSGIGHSDEGRWANIKSGARRGKRRSWVINKKETMSAKWERRCHKPSRKRSVGRGGSGFTLFAISVVPVLWFADSFFFFFLIVSPLLFAFLRFVNGETGILWKESQSFHLQSKKERTQRYKMYLIWKTLEKFWYILIYLN